MDRIDRRILEELQLDSSVSQRVMAERVGLSQNACWRRLQALDTFAMEAIEEQRPIAPA